MVIRSGFQAWPEAGGLNNQDPNFIDDLLTYMHGQSRAQWEIDNDYEPPRPVTPDQQGIKGLL